MPLRVGRGGAGVLVGLGSALLVLGPALGPGYLLRYDMVFVPHLAWNQRLFGVDGSVPRSVPSDFLAAVLGLLAPGWVVQKILLLAVFVLLGVGFARLMPTRLAGVAAGLAAIWSPYLAERLSIGHWPYLLGYACLPFVLDSAASFRDRERGVGELCWWLVAASLAGSTSAVLAAVVALVVLLGPAGADVRPQRRLRDAALVLGVLALLNATWWYSYLFLADSTSGGDTGVAAFRARADTPWGVFASVLTGGGSWNSATWPGARSSAALSGLALVVTVAAIAVAVAQRRRWLRSTRLCGAAVSGAVGLLLVAGSATAPGRWLLDGLVRAVPGAGLVRDTQKFSALWMLFLACAIGGLAQAVRDLGARSGAGARESLAVGCVVAVVPAVLLSGMAWGFGGSWRAVDYPRSVTRLAERVDRLPPGALLVLPWGTYRQYAWNHDTVVLDPWQRLVRRQVVTDDDLPLRGGHVVPGDSADAAAAARILTGPPGRAGSALRALGVRYVLVQPDQPGNSLRPAAPVVARTSAGRVLDLGPATSRRPGRPTLVTAAGWLLAAMGLVAATALSGLDRKRTRRRAR